jgi:hypothetical protein
MMQEPLAISSVLEAKYQPNKDHRAEQAIRSISRTEKKINRKGSWYDEQEEQNSLGLGSRGHYRGFPPQARRQ